MIKIMLKDGSSMEIEKGILYCFDTPTIVTSLNNRYYKYLVQFYKEEDKTVFDIYRITVSDEYNYDAISQNITSKELIYSTSNKYEIHFSKYGVNPNDFFDINFTVEQSTEANYLDLISGTITVKDEKKEVKLLNMVNKEKIRIGFSA